MKKIEEINEKSAEIKKQMKTGGRRLLAVEGDEENNENNGEQNGDDNESGRIADSALEPAVVQVSNLHSLQAINKKRPVAFFLGQPTVKKTTSTSLYKLFEAAAFTLQDQFLHIGFASHASNQDEIVRADTKSPFPKDQSYIVRLEKDEEPRYYPFDDENFSIDDLTVEKLIDWIEYERHQIFTPLTKENFYLTSHSKQNAHLVVSIVNTDDAKETHRVISATHALARAARPPTNHIYSTSDASAAQGVPLERICRHVDSISVCLSKGLGSPVGSLLVGETEFITRARRYRNRYNNRKH